MKTLYTPIIMNKILLICVSMCLSLTVMADDAQLSIVERNAAQGFNDTIDRTAEDFVTVSLVIAEPTNSADDLFGILGHCFLRLQCPTFGLDYCFSYESESVNAQLDKFLVGDLKMGMFSFQTKEYIKDYEAWGRAVHEYKLNLPPDAEQRLWEMLDQEVAKGRMRKFDLIRRGCAISIVKFIERAIYPEKIEYHEWPSYIDQSRHEIMRMHLKDYPWERFVIFTLLGGTYNEDCSNQDKLICPADILYTWSHATIKGMPLLTKERTLVDKPSVKHKEPFTPMLFMLLIFLLTIVFVIIDWKEWDYVLLGTQVVIGCLLLYLYFISSIADHPNLWQLIVYNPLPALLWRWRRYWQIPYAALLMIWILLACTTNFCAVEYEHVVFAVSVILLYCKDWLRTKVVALVKK